MCDHHHNPCDDDNHKWTRDENGYDMSCSECGEAHPDNGDPNYPMCDDGDDHEWDRVDKFGDVYCSKCDMSHPANGLAGPLCPQTIHNGRRCVLTKGHNYPCVIPGWAASF